MSEKQTIIHRIRDDIEVAVTTCSTVNHFVGNSNSRLRPSNAPFEKIFSKRKVR